MTYQPCLCPRVEAWPEALGRTIDRKPKPVNRIGLPGKLLGREFITGHS
jgi:hypothetical protein